MRVEEEWWCSVVFNILQQFLLSSCGTTTSKMKWKSKNSKKGAERHTAWRYLISIRSTSPSIHWKSGRPNIITSLILSQNNALFGKKKIAIGIGLGLFHNSLSKRVLVQRWAGSGSVLFLENAVLGLGLFRVRVRVRISVNPSPNPKTAFFKKRWTFPNPLFYWHPSQTETWIFICPFIRILEPLHVHIVHVAAISNWSRHRAVANIMILSCRVHVTNVRGIVQQGSSFSFIVLFVSYHSSRGSGLW